MHTKRGFFLFTFLLAVLTFFPTNALAKDVLYTCEYSGEKKKGILEIYADLGHNISIQSYNGKKWYGVTGEVELYNWKNVKKDIGRLGCPTYIRYTKDSLQGENHRVQGFWNLKTANKNAPNSDFQLELNNETKSEDFCFYKGVNDGETGVL